MKIALVGNQNSGKTTLFNLLTGMNSKTGNWPGVTIEKKMGCIKGTNYQITDLPGVYSLSPYSTEERVSATYILEDKPDIIINIIDSTSLERSLYLTTQLLELDARVIIALNMADVLEKKGIEINIKKLEELLSVKVVKISALKETGIDELISEIKKPTEFVKLENVYDTNIENKIKQVKDLMQYDVINRRFISVKLLEEDTRFLYLNTAQINNIRQEVSKLYGTDLEEIIATQRYSFIEKTKREVLKKKFKRETTSDKLDKIFLNKILAIPIFIGIMFFIYYLSVGIIGNITIDYVSKLIDILCCSTSNFLQRIETSEWLISLIVDGIISGIGAVLGFIPQLIILLTCISILESTGYMARIALLLDRLFRKIGLSGKSLIPFIVGSGCSVPGIMGTRIIENQDEREMSIILTPFIPCSAKLPIISLFSEYFFAENSGIVSASLYFFAIIIIIFSAWIMKKLVYKNTSSTYISELPEYKVPNVKYILNDVLEKIFEFIKRAGSIIFICSIVIWFLLSFSTNLEYGVNIENSILAKIGKTISWIFYPMLGTNSWGATVSAIQGVIAKEQVISSMAVIAGFLENGQEKNTLFGNTSIFNFFTASSAYAYMVFNLFSAPCFGAIGAMKRELGSNKKVIKAISFQIILAWILGVLVYQIGSKIENGTLNISNILILIVLFVLIIKIVSCSNNERECKSCPYNKKCAK